MKGFVETNLVRSECSLSVFLEGTFGNVTTSSTEGSLRDISAPDILGQFITHVLDNELLLIPFYA